MKIKPVFQVAGIALIGGLGLLMWSMWPPLIDPTASVAKNKLAKQVPETTGKAEIAPVPTPPIQPNSPSAPPRVMPLTERLLAMSARRNGTTFDPQQVREALLSGSVWKTDPSAAQQLDLKKNEREDGREFVRINPLALEALMPGDEVKLPVTQITSQPSVTMVVDSVEQRGGVTWTGHLKEFPSENQVTLTRGKDLIVGGITTPDGHYVVQIHGDIGWVANGFTLFKGLSDDAVVPPPR